MKKVITCGRFEPNLPQIKHKSIKKQRVIREKQSDNIIVKHRRKLSRLFPFKSELDKYFLNDPHQHYEDVFQLENYQGDCLHIDIVSMYPHALLKCRFPHPTRLKYFTDNPLQKIIDNTILQGIFCCTLTIKTNLSKNTKKWIAQHHALRYAQGGKSHHFHWQEDTTINTILHIHDIISLYPYCDINITWSIRDTMDKGIKHPLYNQIKKIAEIKDNTQNKNEKELIKTQLVSLTTVQKKWVKSTNLKELWENTYGEANPEHWEQYTQIDIEKSKIKVPHNSSIYCLFSQIKAYARNEMFHFIKLAKTFHMNPVRIHTDGISFQCKKNNTDQFILELKKNYTFGKKLGNIKAYKSQHAFFLSANVGWIYNLNPTPQIFEHIGTNKNDILNTTLYTEDMFAFPKHAFYDFKKIFKNINNKFFYYRKIPHNITKGIKKNRNKKINTKIKQYNLFLTRFENNK